MGAEDETTELEVLVPSGTRRTLEALAASRGTSTDALVTEALRSYFDAMPPGGRVVAIVPEPDTSLAKRREALR